MSVDTYANLLTEIQNWSDQDFATADATTFITLAEAKIARELRVEAMATAMSITLSGGVAAVPTGFRELRSAFIDGSPARKLDIVGYDELIARYPLRSSDTKPCVIAPNGSNFEFGPFPDSDYTLGGTFYKAFTALSVSANPTNWLLTDAPEFMLYACLDFGAKFTRDDSAPWAALYQAAKRDIEREDKKKRLSSRMSLGGVAR